MPLDTLTDDDLKRIINAGLTVAENNTIGIIARRIEEHREDATSPAILAEIRAELGKAMSCTTAVAPAPTGLSIETSEDWRNFLKPPPLAHIARAAYHAYAATTDNKNYQGLEMPAWEKLPEKIQTAWQAAVEHAMCVDQVGKTYDLTDKERQRYCDPAKYKGWTPPKQL